MRKTTLFLALSVMFLYSCKESTHKQDTTAIDEESNTEAVDTGTFDIEFSVELKTDADNKSHWIGTPWKDGEKDPLMVKSCPECPESNLLSLADEAMADFFLKYIDAIDKDFKDAKGSGLKPIVETIKFHLKGSLSDDGKKVEKAQVAINSDWKLFSGENIAMVIDQSYENFDLSPRGNYGSLQGVSTETETIAYGAGENTIEGGNCECFFPTCYVDCTTCPAPYTVDRMGNCWKNICKFSLYLECWCVNHRKIPCP